MRQSARLAVFALLILAGASISAQGFKSEREFDCGTIARNSSGAMLYQEFSLGFQFEFPADWQGNSQFLRGPEESSEILLNPLIAGSDPKFYVKEPAKPTGIETINGLTWTTLTWQNGGRGYYTYSHNVAIELFAPAFGLGKNNPVNPDALAALQQILSTFTFFDDPYRLDRQLGALKVGQRFGDLTITRIIPSVGGFDHPLATIEFAGQLTITGHIVLPSPTMLGGWGPYTLYPEDESRSAIPRLKCPVENLVDVTRNTVGVGISNQEFTNQQFARVPSISGNHAWYEAETTVVVDRITQDFFAADETNPSISARLVKVISKKEGP